MPPLPLLGWLTHRQPWLLRSFTFIACALGIGAARPDIAASCPICYEDGPSSGPNVLWSLADSLSACPAGDSVFSGHPTHPHASRLRINVWYNDNDCSPKPGIPPDSIYVTWATAEGNARVNDTGAQVFADDTTNGCGHARITMPSLSGCGKLTIQLFVHQYLIGTKTVVVRTTDTNADGRVTSADATGACDLDYDNFLNDVNDIIMVLANSDHWHRNALHGTLVRRTNYCGIAPCAGMPGIIGRSQVAWSPNGKWLAFTAQNQGGCKVYITASDPANGNAIRQVTFASPVDSSDYDPSWSPLGKEITFGRKDNTIYRKGIPGFATDLNTYLVTFHSDGGPEQRGDLTGAISPDGQWVAFSRRTVPDGPYELFKIPINGDVTQRVKLTTHAVGTDFYPSWSPDGQYILFQRGINDLDYSLHRVRADGTGEASFYKQDTGKPNGYEAATAAYVPDGKLVVAGIGPTGVGDSVVTWSLDPALAVKKPVKVFGYNDAAFAVDGFFPILSPRISPDGTRLALGSDQLWAARRNMNLPPRITQVGSQGVVDSTAVVTINAAVGLQTQVQVLSTDPETDPDSCSAYFLQNGMTFNQSNCTLTWTPSLPVGTTVYVKFLVSNATWPKASGGSDAILATFNVVSTLQNQVATRDAANLVHLDGPNPTRGQFAITAPHGSGGVTSLSIYDASGRRVALMKGQAGSQLVWNGRDKQGLQAPAGIYLYRMEAGATRTEGKFVVIR